MDIFIIIVHWMKIENYLPSSAASFLYGADLSDVKNECLIEGWDIVEHPTLPTTAKIVNKSSPIDVGLKI
ncbi:hypothetical protein CR513_24800, partial [Mucuna pruriens]